MVYFRGSLCPLCPSVWSHQQGGHATVVATPRIGARKNACQNINCKKTLLILFSTISTKMVHTSWCTWQESSLQVQQCSERLPYTIACKFYSRKDEIFPGSYLVFNTLHGYRQNNRLCGWWLTENNEQTKYLTLKYDRTEHGYLELWNFSSCLLLHKVLSLFYLQDLWIFKRSDPENQHLMDGNSSIYFHKHIFTFSPFYSYAHMQRLAHGAVLQEMRCYSTPSHRAKSWYLPTNNPI